jgi:hypothetical protein
MISYNSKISPIWTKSIRGALVDECEDLVEWLGTLRTKLLSHMPHWKPSCFIVDDAPQEL